MANNQGQTNARSNRQIQAPAQNYAAILQQFKADADAKLEKFLKALDAATDAVRTTRVSGAADHPRFQDRANSGSGVQGPPD